MMHIVTYNHQQELIFVVYVKTVTCPMGQEDKNDTCVACAVGYYKEAAGSTACDQCPQTPFALTTAGDGSTLATDCAIGM